METSATKTRSAALGLRAHSGWAVMVAVSGGSAVLRRRIEMTKGSGYRARQPYHAAEEMQLQQAEAFLQRTEKTATEMAAAAVRDTVALLASEGYRVLGAAVLLGSGRPLPELGKILDAHPLIHTAEGVFFREVLKSACEGVRPGGGGHQGARGAGTVRGSAAYPSR
jgi:hypothetical protein